MERSIKNHDYKQLSALVVGMGSIGSQHLVNLKALGIGRLGVVRRPQHQINDNEALKGVMVYSDLNEALRQNYDVAVIATPSSLHLKSALPAARAGCHLYIEKPLSNSLNGLDDLAQEVAARNLKIQIGCQLRMHPALLQMIKWLKNGWLGDLSLVRAEVGSYLPDWHPGEDYHESYVARPELGGGVVLTLIHEIDALLWLFGNLEPICALGSSSKLLGLQVEDSVAALLRSSQCPMVLLQMDLLQRPACRIMKLVGEKGHAEVDLIANAGSLWVNGKIIKRHCAHASWSIKSLLPLMMADFLGSLFSDRPPCCGLDSGIRALKVGLAMKSMLNILN